MVTISIGRHRTTTLEAFFDFIREIFDDPKLRVAIIRRMDPGLWDDDEQDPDEVDNLNNGPAHRC